MAEVIKGYVNKIVFRNADNGYTVLSLACEEDEVTCVGNFTFISEGEFIEAEGNYTAHNLYGEQFQVVKYEMKEPESIFSMETYLASGAIKGIGAALAARIIKKFGKESFHIIEEEPERLTEIKGISERKAREIAHQFEEKREVRNAALFLQQFGISLTYVGKIQKQYGAKMYEIVKENPYRLAEDIHGIGFKMADEIAKKAGIGTDSDYRVQAGILYTLSLASGSGHTFLPEEMLIQRASELLGIEAGKIEHHIMDMLIDKRIMVKELDERKAIYSSTYYYMELNTARMLIDLNIKYDCSIGDVNKRIAGIEEQSEISLDTLQRTAVMEAARNGLLIITGGPGTGKTTTINTIIKFFEAEGMDILLAAPTGRAAKRMSETTGCEAQTIHRLLEISGNPEEKDRLNQFEKNESNPLEADVIIIDEMSMVDIHLMHALLKAVLVGTRLILVGDVNQLPSVGPGNVLKDIIRSHQFNVVMLTKIFRQASESDIIINAHKINAGERILLDNKSRDFFFLKRNDVNVIISVIITLISKKIPKYVNASPYDIQVLTPMRKGELGVERLNKILQQYLNPPSEDKKEKEFYHTIFREGDKVMQIKNNYQLAWEVKSKYGVTVETGSGIYNGDSGIIKEINLFAENLTVEFDEGKAVEYSFSQADELELAYAVTIHKSQGSEYPAVIIPILSGPRMLFNRNLLYTAVTRAKSCVTIVGSENMVQFMIDNSEEQKRYSSLDTRIQEIAAI